MNGQRSRLIPALLAAAAFAAYFGIIQSGELEWVYDDVRFVADNPAIRDLGNAGRFFTDPTTMDPYSWAGIYRPLRTLDWSIDWAITRGFSATARVRWFHIRNVLYHVLAVLLAYWLFLRIGAGRAASGLGALVFAIHPVQVESVAWITSRADVMCLVFFLGGLHFHLSSRGPDRRFLGAICFLALALLSKEAALTFPAAAALMDFFFRDERRFRATLRRWWVYGTYALVAGLYLGLWVYLHRAHEGNIWGAGGLYAGLSGQLLTMARGFVYYLRLIILPVDLAQDYYIGGIRTPDILTVLCGALVIGLLVAALRRAARGGGAFAFAVLWFLVTLFPASNLAIPIGIPTAERFLYLPLLGVALLAGTLLVRALRWGRPGIVLVAVAMACLFATSYSRAFVWETRDGLWRSTARYESPRAVGWWADRLREEAEDLQVSEKELRDQGLFDEAIAVKREADGKLREAITGFRQSVDLWERILPGSQATPYARSNEAICFYDLGLHDQAFRIADAAVRAAPRLPRAWYARSLALLGLGRIRESAADLEQSLVLRPSEPQRRAGAGIYEKLAEDYDRKGNRAGAYRALVRSWELLPSEEENPAVRDALDRTTAEFQRLGRQLEATLKQDPANGDAWLELACLLAAHGDYEGAKPKFDNLLSEEQAGRIPGILGPYALYFWQWRDTEEGYREAIRIWREVLEMDPGMVEAREELQKCEAELERLEEQK